MAEKLTDRRTLRSFTALCSLVYFTSYITRLSYAAALAAILVDTGFSKSAASLAVTGCFFTYGIGQLISGLAGDRARPHRMVTIGLLGSALCNLILPFLPGAGSMTILWCLNGFFQSMIWPPLVRILSELTTPTDYVRSITTVTAVACGGTVAIYLIVPLAVFAGNWRYAFWGVAVGGLLVTLIWLRGAKQFGACSLTGSTSHWEQRQGSTLTLQTVQRAGLGLIALAIIFLGVLRDGVTTWMPTNLTDTYNLPPEGTIALTALVAVLSIVAVYFSGFLQQRMQNEVKTAAVLFAAGLAATALLVPLVKTSALISTVLMMVCISMMHGANNMFISRIPAHFKRYHCVSTMSGVLNFFVYVGASLSTYGVALLTERFGWMATAIAWALAALGGTLCCLARIGTWRRFAEGEHTDLQIEPTLETQEK